MQVEQQQLLCLLCELRCTAAGTGANQRSRFACRMRCSLSRSHWTAPCGHSRCGSTRACWQSLRKLSARLIALATAWPGGVAVSQQWQHRFLHGEMLRWAGLSVV